KYKDCVIISAERGINISVLKERINELVQSSFVEEKVHLDIGDSKTAAKIHSLAEVLSTKYDDNSVQITYKANKENSAKIKKMVFGT
ncbi:MAG: GTPase HflX, partial [Ignavibacteriaceae bacterium]|nr:GTPase HflX [Ignavibacteriaceae bacterium]MDR3668618.1 GTPase HflX [Ignavibacteriaceae bacterium]